MRKSKKVFDSAKVTDHHAIIPTGVTSNLLTADEQRVYDRVARRFIAVFYDDCEFATTTVLGRAADVDFKVTGKQILSAGWRSVFKREDCRMRMTRHVTRRKSCPPLRPASVARMRPS